MIHGTNSNGHFNGFTRRVTTSPSVPARSERTSRFATPLESSPRAHTPKRRPSLWPGLIFALIGLNVSIVAITIIAATSDKSFAIEPGYYDQAMHWNDHAAAKASSDLLGWTVSFRITRSTTHSDPSHQMPMLVAAIADRNGAPVENATLTAAIFHNARSSDRYPLDFRALTTGQYAALAPIDRLGVWQIRFKATRAGQTFIHDDSITISAELAGGRQ